MDEEERKAHFLKVFLTVIVIVLTASLIFVGVKLYQEYKPLPNIAECQDHEAGVYNNGKAYCFDECEGKEVTTCKKISTPSRL